MGMLELWSGKAWLPSDLPSRYSDQFSLDLSPMGIKSLLLYHTQYLVNENTELELVGVISL